MKFSLILLLSFIYVGSFAQKKDIEVLKKDSDGNVILVCKNRSTLDYLVKLEVNSVGLEKSKKTPLEVIVYAGTESDLIILAPIPGKSWEYTFNVAYREVTIDDQKIDSSKTDLSSIPVEADTILSKKQKNIIRTTSGNQKVQLSARQDQGATGLKPGTDVELPENLATGIIIYSKSNCGRCIFAKQYLSDSEILFSEVDIDQGGTDVDNLWIALSKAGFEGGRVSTPVIAVDGKFHYNIKDLNGFLKRLTMQ